jgi:iron complex outermembrane receptor protein
MMPRRLPLLLVCVLAPLGARAELPTPEEQLVLETDAPRSPQRVLESPYAISVVTQEEFERARPALALDEALDLVPGVFAQGGRNFAQDARVSIRGYGARADFGVRGIRLLIDGVPSTLPDGQTETDSLDLAFAERIDVVRSPVSSLYGGGGGGIIAVDTLRPTPEPEYRSRVLFGTDHLSRYVVSATGTSGKTGWALGSVYTRHTGYRDHARARQGALLAKLEHEFASGWQLRTILSAVRAPEAQDAGGLTTAEVSDDRTQARGLNVVRNAHEKLEQQKLSLELRRPLGQDQELRALVYGLQREFSNALPIDRRVDLDRDVYGAALSWLTRTGPIGWALGIDADLQQDRRRNFENIAGARGARTLDQSETVRAVGPWLNATWRLRDGIDLIGGLRYDWFEFLVGDRFVSGVNGDRSDRIHFRKLSPHLGVRWDVSSRLQLYLNLGTAFNVPTTTELAPSDAAGGFQSDLDPEKTRGLEFGVKGLLGKRFAYDVALFDLQIRNVAVPFEPAPMAPIVWRDAGEVRRRGVELALTALLARGVSARVAYTYADYRYKDFQTPDGDFDGNREPNIPQHSVTGELRWTHASGWFAVVSLRHYSDLEANDANSAESSGATLSDVRVGYDWRSDRWSLQPFAGVRNYTRAKYDQTLRPNAFGGRYYEPAPLAEMYVGVDVRFH